MSTRVDYGDMTEDEFFDGFRWLCKCGHVLERHPDPEVWGDEGEACWDCDDCKGLSDEPITVLELINDHYGTDWDAPEYARTVPSKWAHILAFGPDHNLAIRYTESRDVRGYSDAVCDANYQTLQENWEWHPALIDGGYSIGLKWNAPAPFDLIEVIESLENSTVFPPSLVGARV